MKPLRVAFFGTPEFAVPTLEALARQHHVLLAVTQPPKPAGRGLTVRQPAAARLAEARDIEVAQPRRLRDPEFLARLRALDLDVGVTAAYGRILPPALLELPRFGVLNVHASLLPRWRGAAPIQHALIAGDAETGITIMQTEEGLDTGPIRLQRRVTVAASDDAVTLAASLAQLGAEVLTEALTLLAADSLPVTPQDEGAVTVAPPLTALDGHVRWHASAVDIANRHRGVAGWPGSSFEFGGSRVKVLELTALPDAETGAAAPGQVVRLTGDVVQVAAGSGIVELSTVKPASKGAMSARAWANGRGVRVGAVLV